MCGPTVFRARYRGDRPRDSHPSWLSIPTVQQAFGIQMPVGKFLICEFPSELAKPIIDDQKRGQVSAGEDHARALFARELCETHRGAINLAKAVLAIDANQLALVAIGPSVIRATKARLMAFSCKQTLAPRCRHTLIKQCAFMSRSRVSRSGTPITVCV